jgi:hypothetical protein
VLRLVEPPESDVPQKNQGHESDRQRRD